MNARSGRHIARHLLAGLCLLPALLLSSVPYASEPASATPVAKQPAKPSAKQQTKPAVSKAAGAKTLKFNCSTIFDIEDPRLFDFVKTRKGISYARYKDKVVGDITYVTLPVFNELDKRENNGLYRLVNRLHVLTKADPIEKKLIIKPGDRVDDEIIRESERILRGEGYIYDAMILPGESCGETLDLLVVVRDIWTLQPDVSFSRTGGDNSTAYGITEDNLLGTGQSVSVSFDKNAARNGVGVGYRNKHLFDGHSELSAAYVKNNDGYYNQLSLTRPFYAIETPWSAGFTYSEGMLRETIEANNVIANEYNHREEDEEVFVGVSLGVVDNIVHRIRVGITRDFDRFSGQDPAYTAPMPANRLLAYPWIEYEALENAFWTTSNLSQLFRNEDVNVGVGWKVRLGATSRLLGTTQDMFVGKLDWTNVVSFGKNHLFRGTANASMYWNKRSGDYESSLYGYTAIYDGLIDDNNRWHALFEYSAGLKLTQDNELTAGGEANLLGYPAYWQRGNRRAILNIERRHFYEVHVLNLFRLGSAIFLETGKAWDSGNGIVQSDNVLADVGVGLRINSSKARPSHIMHINIAFPLADRRDAGDFQWSVFTANTF